MQDNSARKDAKPGDARRAADDEINRRLVDHLQANAIKVGGPVAANDTEPQRGFFAEAFALVSLFGLMIAAFVYAKLVDKNAT
jgi:hypothetical protein